MATLVLMFAMTGDSYTRARPFATQEQPPTHGKLIGRNAQTGRLPAGGAAPGGLPQRALSSHEAAVAAAAARFQLV